MTMIIMISKLIIARIVRSLHPDTISNPIIWLLGQQQKGVIARSYLLRPGGPLAFELARHAVVLKVNDWVFCHGGLLPHHGNY